MMNLLRQYRLILAVSLIVWIAVWYFLGFSAFVVTVILTVLSLAFNAAVRPQATRHGVTT